MRPPARNHSNGTEPYARLDQTHRFYRQLPKIALSSPPIETPRGWLVIYHGVRLTAAGAIYRLGLALFDLQEPEHCIKRGGEWIFNPQEVYEQRGDVDNVVFPCGYTVAPDGDTIHLYYGAADTSIAMATGSLHAILEWLERDGNSPVELPTKERSLYGNGNIQEEAERNRAAREA